MSDQFDFDVWYNWTKIIPKYVQYNSDGFITALDLSGLQLNFSPSQIDQLQFLKFLNLDSFEDSYCYFKKNHFQNLPEVIRLKEITIQENSLKKLSNTIEDLMNLPNSIGNLINLRAINLKSNSPVSNLSNESLQYLLALTYLEKLDMSSNFIQYFPYDLSRLQSLIILDLSTNKLNTIPDSIPNLIGLKKLNFNFNDLTELPYTIGNLIALRQLHLNNNKLTELPETVGNLIALRQLDLSFNHLTKLPGHIGRLHNLETVDLSSNQLVDLPIQIVQWNVKELNLSNNPMTRKTIAQIRKELPKTIVIRK